MAEAPAALETARVRPGAPARVARVAFALVAVGGVVGVGLIIGIAAALSGVWRVLALALLTPVLIISVLSLWRAARAVATLAARRARTVAELRERGVVGVLATPPLAGPWQARVDRALRLAAGRNLLAVDAATETTAPGQRALHALYDLLGEARPRAVTLALPPRATLALLEPNDDATLWDLSGLFERADAGDEAALDDLAALEQLVQARAAAAALGEAP